MANRLLSIKELFLADIKVFFLKNDHTASYRNADFTLLKSIVKRKLTKTTVA